MPVDFKKLVERIKTSSDFVEVMIYIKADGEVHCIGLGYLTLLGNVIRVTLEQGRTIISGTINVISGKMVVKVLQIDRE